MGTRTPSGPLVAVILAAGKGDRLKSDLPKVLHDVSGRPSLWHVIRAARAARPSRIVVVVGRDADQVRAAVVSWNDGVETIFVDQGKLLGTGHAVMAAEPALERAREVLVLAGDGPLVTGAQVRKLMATHRRTKAAASLLTTELPDPAGYGRVVRDGNRLIEIAEEADAGTSSRKIREVSTLVYAFRRDDLFKALPLVGRENRKREYYLQDVFPILQDKGERVSVVSADFGGALGINSRTELAAVTSILRARIIEQHMSKGVTIVDPANSYVDVDVRIGRDTVIHPLTLLQGATTIGAGCSIGPATRIVDSSVGDGTEVSMSVVKGARIGPGASVGPYASIRPDTVLEEGAKAGTFVEIKKSRVGKGSKVPHLSYVGDATIGEGANIGAGVVTVNYDGVEKHRTVIGDRAFVGSDTMLVAPVEVGDDASTGAGSVITRDVPAGALAVERAEQRIVPGYADRKRAARSKGKAKTKRRGGRG